MAVEFHLCLMGSWRDCFYRHRLRDLVVGASPSPYSQFSDLDWYTPSLRPEHQQLRADGRRRRK